MTVVLPLAYALVCLACLHYLHDEVLTEPEQRLQHVFERRLQRERLAARQTVEVRRHNGVDVRLNGDGIRRERVAL